MKRQTSIAFVFMLMLVGCSSTSVFQASSYYAGSQTGAEIKAYASKEKCAQADAGQCREITLSWKNERYCNLFSNAAPRITDVQLRWKDESPRTMQDSAKHEAYGLVIVGDDSEFEFAGGTGKMLKGDLICGKFESKTDLVPVRAGARLKLLFFCKGITPSTRFIRAYPAGYPMTVSLDKEEKTGLGCK